jgi:hypothetical protein
VLLGVFRQQEKTRFWDIAIGDESWIFISTAPSFAWLSFDEELSTRPGRIISTDKRMLIAFWGIKGLVYVNWLPKDVRINGLYFWDEILIPISQKLQTDVSTGYKPSALVHMDKAKIHTAKTVSSVMPNLRLKRTHQPPYSTGICPSDFFLFGWFKGKLQQHQFTDPDQLFEVVDEVFSSVSVDMTEDVSRNQVHRLVQVIASDGDDVQ